MSRCPNPDCPHAVDCELAADLRQTLQAGHDLGSTVSADLAAVLCLSHYTVDNRFKRILDHFGLNGRQGVDRRYHAVAMALDLGCIRRRK